MSYYICLSLYYHLEFYFLYHLYVITYVPPIRLTHCPQGDTSIIQCNGIGIIIVVLLYS